MANSLYQFKSDKVNPGHFVCTKLNDDYEVEETYHISVIGSTEMICTCPAGSKSKCRHRTMLVKFREKKLVDQNWSYIFDKDKWVAPLGALDIEGEDN